MDTTTYLSNLLTKTNNRTIDISSLPVTYPGMLYDTWYKKPVVSGFTIFYPSTILTITYIIEIDIGISPCNSNPPDTSTCIRFSDFNSGVSLTTIPDSMALASINSLPISNDYTMYIIAGLGIITVVLLASTFIKKK